MRLLTADTHPDHDTICALRCANQALLNESFVKVLQLTVAAGGTPTGTVVNAAVATDRPSPQRGRFGKEARA